jgi:hypothetical protein
MERPEAIKQFSKAEKFIKDHFPESDRWDSICKLLVKKHGQEQADEILQLARKYSFEMED